jgi:outer membrane lipoprotein-sorting protein
VKSLLAAVLLALAVPAAAEPALVAAMEAAYARVEAYTARFERQEVVGGVQRPRHEILLKYQRPGRIYMRWLTGPKQGREILLVPGRDDGHALVHEPGAVAGLFTLVMPPDSPHILKQSRYPVTDVGIGRLIELIGADARRAEREGRLGLRELGPAQDGGRPARAVELTFPADRALGYHARRVVVTVDAERSLPLRAKIHDHDDRLVGEYAYLDVRLDVRLTALDFDPANPSYGFPRWRLRP